MQVQILIAKPRERKTRIAFVDALGFFTRAAAGLAILISAALSVIHANNATNQFTLIAAVAVSPQSASLQHSSVRPSDGGVGGVFGEPFEMDF